ncbi:MarR family winged helix-turn-helix transcriptional regulator [Streptomyces smyrnaeus]|uniref:MarR family transcriptional regulator n=1 Tax=Streptomyces smyrnaeus TaxID=1387713 RepID=A0ABS3Y0R4_9ACTN|nr:MarR family transcriptional regulator [Streptomyces smyrnaeus]MBO8201128.1 MarR family transcriptional regulator [Streptomyces smyrnaeus]
MAERGDPVQGLDDVDAVTRAVLTASRVLVAVSASSLAEVEDRVTLPQFRMLVALSSRGATKLVALADLLRVAPSTAMRMADRLITAGLVDRQTNPHNRRETLLTLTDEGRSTVGTVTSRRRRELAAVVERLAPGQRAALVEALTAFNEAGGEPAVPPTDIDVPYPLGWADLAQPAPSTGPTPPAPTSPPTPSEPH